MSSFLKNYMLSVRTLVISMLISRIDWLTWGSLTSEFDNLMISVDFWSEPVTFAIASEREMNIL